MTVSTYTEMILPGGDSHLQVCELSKGISGKLAERLRKRANIDEAAFSGIIGYSRMHYSRLVKDGDKNLKAAATNRLYRFAQVLEHATALYEGDEETALLWLKAPNPAFGDQTPLAMLSSEVGANLVDTLISQIELGISPA